MMTETWMQGIDAGIAMRLQWHGVQFWVPVLGSVDDI